MKVTVYRCKCGCPFWVAHNPLSSENVFAMSWAHAMHEALGIWERLNCQSAS